MLTSRTKIIIINHLKRMMTLCAQTNYLQSHVWRESISITQLRANCCPLLDAESQLHQICLTKEHWLQAKNP